MTLAEILKDSNYKLTQFNLVEISNLEKKLSLKQTRKGMKSLTYVLNQEFHHKKRSFRQEYLEILKRNDIRFDDKYIFDFFNE